MACSKPKQISYTHTLFPEEGVIMVFVQCSAQLRGTTNCPPVPFLLHKCQKKCSHGWEHWLDKLFRERILRQEMKHFRMTSYFVHLGMIKILSIFHPKYSLSQGSPSFPFSCQCLFSVLIKRCIYLYILLLHILLCSGVIYWYILMFFYQSTRLVYPGNL